MALRAGQWLRGKYKIQGELAPGGFSRVYHAIEGERGREVAIKELIFTDERAGRRFYGEFQTMMLLNHPKIVQVFEIFADQGNHFMVMEYLAGGSLQALLEKQHQLSLERAMRIVNDICEALSFIHSNHVVHCDIKPANILLTSDGTAKLSDFEISHISELLQGMGGSPTSKSFRAGTLFYMSPEHVEGVRDDPRIDIYAIGAVFYQILAGRFYLDFDMRAVPASDKNNITLIQSSNPKPPSAHNSKVPPWLDRILLRTLEKQRERRQSTISQLISELQQQQRTLIMFEEMKALVKAGQWGSAIRCGSELLTLAPNHARARQMHAFAVRQYSKEQKSRSTTLAKKQITVKKIINRYLAANGLNEQERLLDEVVSMGSSATGYLLKLLDHTDNSIIRRTAVALAAIGDNRASGPLLALMEKDPWLAPDAYFAIAGPTAIEPLLKSWCSRMRSASAKKAAYYRGHSYGLSDNDILSGAPYSFGGLVLSGAGQWADLPEEVETLLQFGRQGIPIFTRLLRTDPEPLVRAWAASLLAMTGDPIASESLMGATSDPEPMVRWDAACAIALVKNYRGVPFLTNLLQDIHPLVRKAAAESLGAFNEPLSVQALLGALQYSDPAVRSAAYLALGRIGDRTAVPHLLIALHSETQWAVLEDVIRGLGELGDSRATEPLLHLLNSLSVSKDFEQTQTRIIIALGKLRDARAVEGLLSILLDQNDTSRQFAATALGEIGDERAVGPLLGAMQRNNDLGIRSSSVQALGKLGSKKAIPVLANALADPLIADQALVALCKLGSRKGVEFVEGLLKDRNVSARAQGVSYLKELDSPWAIERLALALKEKQPMVHHAAVNALSSHIFKIRASRKDFPSFSNGNRSRRFDESYSLLLVEIIRMLRSQRGKASNDVIYSDPEYLMDLTLSIMTIDQATIRLLIPMIHCSNMDVRAAGALALKHLPIPKRMDHLTRMLQDKAPRVRSNAIRALAEINDQQALPYLQRTANGDPLWHIRREAQIASWRMERESSGLFNPA